MPLVLRLRPFRALAYKLIDAGVFRNALEERLKRQYIVVDANPAVDDADFPLPGVTPLHGAGDLESAAG